jgi:hypothetical protein
MISYITKWYTLIFNYLTASLRPLPGTNAGVLLSAISSSSPVCGLRLLQATFSPIPKEFGVSIIIIYIYRQQTRIAFFQI